MPYKFRVHVILIACLTNLFSHNAHAFQSEPLIERQPNEQIEEKSDISQVKLLQDSARNKFFMPYEVNSIMLKKTSGDENASEIKISMRYFFRAQNDDMVNLLESGFNPFFSYTTKADFYWQPFHDTRLSGPVINRYNNPALHFRKDMRNINFSNIDWLDVGIEHISNGQTLDAQINKLAIQNAYRSNNQNNHILMDSISRVGATVALTFEAHTTLYEADTKSTWPLSNDLTIKWFAKRWGQEADVFWGPLANQNVNFNDFQRVRAQWRIKLKSTGDSKLPIQFNAEMNIGDRGFSEDSWNFMLNLPILIGSSYLPFALTAHRGPMNNLSDYTTPQNTIAAGFTFAY